MKKKTLSAQKLAEFLEQNIAQLFAHCNQFDCELTRTNRSLNLSVQDHNGMVMTLDIRKEAKNGK